MTLEWLLDSAPKVLGVLGFLLSAFNQWQLQVERRRKREREEPHAVITARRLTPRGTGEVQIEIVNPTLVPLLITEASVKEPKGLILITDAQTDRETRTGSTVALHWTVKRSVAGSTHSARLFFSGEPETVSGNTLGGSTIRFTIILSAEEISPKARRIRMQATAIVREPSATAPPAATPA